MKALDSLKIDIDDYKEVLASSRLELKNHIKYLHDNYDNMTLNLIKGVINGLNKEISNISKADRELRIMEQYYNLFKKEQNNATDDSDLFEAGIKAIQGKKYKHYYNSKYDLDEVIKRLNSKKYI